MSPRSQPEPKDTSPLFELDGISFAVEGKQLLGPLTLALPARRMIGLVGHNGSGKSTLLKILARQLSASSGQVRFEGRLLAEWGNRALARRIAFLPQQPPAAPGLLVRELVALGRYPWHGALGRVTATDRDKVEEAIGLTDIAPLANRLVDTLSGGERQRAWIAMLIAQDAGCLLLDEPISALDIAHQTEVLALVRRLAHEKGLGIVAVLHDINMAARHCDEIVALHSGKAIASGRPEMIVNPATLHRIYGIDMNVLPHPATGQPIALPG